jgi:hypothetical protein
MGMLRSSSLGLTVQIGDMVENVDGTLRSSTHVIEILFFMAVNGCFLRTPLLDE